MFNINLLYIFKNRLLQFILVVLIFIFAIEDLSFAQGNFAPCFSFAQTKVSSAEKEKLINYLMSLQKKKLIPSKALETVCPSLKKSTILEPQQLAQKIKIDGVGSDWKNIPVAVYDKKDNLVDALTAKPVADKLPEMDITEVRYLLTKNNLFIYFRNAAPASKETSYWLNIYDEQNSLLFAVYIWMDEKVYLNLYEDNKFVKVLIPKTNEAEAKIGDIVEARISRSFLPLLNNEQNASALSYKDKKLANYTNKFKLVQADFSLSTTAGFLLAKYGEELNFNNTDALPLALSISESFIYENVVSSIKEQVIKDGITMLNEAEIFKEKFSSLPFESLVAWANRSFFWGALSGFYLDEQGKITDEAYHFIILQPSLLKEVRSYLLQKEKITVLLASINTSEVANALDKWATSKNHYRWKLKVVKQWNEDNPFYQKLYQETLEDHNKGIDKITTVNGNQIYFWLIMSANFQWDFFKKNDFFYGPCGDVAIMAQLGLKAFGIPDTTFFRRYGPEDISSHTFIGYYDEKDALWKIPEIEIPPKDFAVKPYAMLQWSLPPILTNIQWKKNYNKNLGDVVISERSPYDFLTGKELQKKLETGFSNEEFALRLYSQLETKMVE